MLIGYICRTIKNWFTKEVVCGTYTIHNGELSLTTAEGNTVELKNDQYFRIVGSTLNDDVYKYPVNNLKDEVFVGAVWAMAVPNDFLALVDDISAWIDKYGESSMSPYISESFGGYSYSKQSGGASSGTSADWKGVFKNSLDAWRKI